VAPPTANVTRADLEFPGLLIEEKARPAAIGATLNTSLGFGGANTCAVLSHARAPEQVKRAPLREVLITGAGFLSPGIVGNEALAARLSEPHPSSVRGGSMDEAEYAHLINARRMRRMSAYSKISLAATVLALKDAGITDVPLFAEECSVILGTTHGSASFCCEYYRPIVEQGMSAANPVLFAEGVPNAASAQLSLMLGIKGACQTIIGSRTAGLDALRLASLRIATGQWERAIVGAAEEDIDALNGVYRHFGLRATGGPGKPFENEDGFVTSCGAVALVLESRDSMEGRRSAGASVRGLGRVISGCSVQGGLDGVDRVLRDIGDLDRIITSANGTRLDRAEKVGLDLSARRRGRNVRISSISSYLGEMFATGPLAAAAGVLLSRRMPGAQDGGISGKFGILVTDYSGFVCGACLETVDGG
jgi:3-oxoacyl-[acyl-carrier-protein] synthase II